MAVIEHQNQHKVLLKFTAMHTRTQQCAQVPTPCLSAAGRDKATRDALSGSGLPQPELAARHYRGSSAVRAVSQDQDERSQRAAATEGSGQHANRGAL